MIPWRISARANAELFIADGLSQRNNITSSISRTRGRIHDSKCSDGKACLPRK